MAKIYLSISNLASTADIVRVKSAVQEMMPNVEIVTYHDNQKNLSANYINSEEWGMIVIPPKQNICSRNAADTWTLAVGKGSLLEAEFALSREIPTLFYFGGSFYLLSNLKETGVNWQNNYGVLYAKENDGFDINGEWYLAFNFHKENKPPKRTRRLL